MSKMGGQVNPPAQTVVHNRCRTGAVDQANSPEARDAPTALSGTDGMSDERRNERPTKRGTGARKPPPVKAGGQRGNPAKASRPPRGDSVPPAAQPAPLPPLIPLRTYRVEGMGRRGMVRFVRIVGRPGEWSVFGIEGLIAVVPVPTVDDAIKRTRRQIGFRPLVIRPMDESEPPRPVAEPKPPASRNRPPNRRS